MATLSLTQREEASLTTVPLPQTDDGGEPPATLCNARFGGLFTVTASDVCFVAFIRSRTFHHPGSCHRYGFRLTSSAPVNIWF